MVTRGLIFTSALLLAGSAGAAELYAGVGLGGAVEGGTFREGVEEFAATDGDAWKLFAGVRIGRHLALEVARHELSDQLCCRDVADLGFHTSVEAYSAAALGRWPVGRAVPFFKVGVLAWEEDGEFITLIGPTPRSEDGTDLLLGAGVDVELPARLGLRGEWERYEFGGTSSDSLMASVLFRF